MARTGKNVNVEAPIYALDKNRGSLRIPCYSGDETYATVRSLKFINRTAYDNHVFELEIGGKRYRFNKDEILAGLQYV